MPRPVCITYDSTCDLTPQLLERFQIRTVPLTIQSGERVFADDGQYTSAELYADYRRNGTLPKTAAVSPEEFKNFFLPILEEGYDIVHIDISSELSCTCQNAMLAAQELAEQGRVYVVDSRQLSTGGGLLALQGAKLRDSGMDAADVAEKLRGLASCGDTSFVLDTLEYMWKGGRCSGVAALGANVLKLKPCLEMRPCLYHPFRRGIRGHPAGADGAGAGACTLQGGVHHPGGLHRVLSLRPGYAGRPVPAAAGSVRSCAAFPMKQRT